MKTFTAILFFSFFNLLLYGQSSYDESLYFKDVTANYITKDGKVGELKTIYHPLLLKSTAIGLGTLNNEGISKDKLQAFYVGEDVWMLKSTPAGMQWVVMEQQGAINEILYITSETAAEEIVEEKLSRDIVDDYKSKDIKIITGGLYEKPGVKTYSNTDFILGFKKKMPELTSDNEEISNKIKNKESGYKFMNVSNVISEYNEWYEENNPGKVKVITPADMGVAGYRQKVSLDEGLSNLKSMKEKSEKGMENKKASRPSEPSPEIASSAPNNPVKKETFAEKVNRIAADGNKIGILLDNPHLYVKPYPASTFGTDVGLRDTLPAYEQLESLANRLAEKLNTNYSTDIFEVVDLSKIPYREINLLGKRLADDWWSTKYKVLFTFGVDTYYQFYRNTEGMTEGEFRTNMNLTGTEFSLDGKPKQDIILTTYNMGNYYLQLGKLGDQISKESLNDALAQFEKSVDETTLSKDLEKNFEKRYEKLVKKKLD